MAGAGSATLVGREAFWLALRHPRTVYWLLMVIGFLMMLVASIKTVQFHQTYVGQDMYINAIKPFQLSSDVFWVGEVTAQDPDTHVTLCFEWPAVQDPNYLVVVQYLRERYPVTSVIPMPWNKDARYCEVAPSPPDKTVLILGVVFMLIAIICFIWDSCLSGWRDALPCSHCCCSQDMNKSCKDCWKCIIIGTCCCCRRRCYDTGEIDQCNSDCTSCSNDCATECDSSPNGCNVSECPCCCLCRRSIMRQEWCPCWYGHLLKTHTQGMHPPHTRSAKALR